MLKEAKIEETIIINGINVAEFEKTVHAVKGQPTLAKFRFRAKNWWDNGGYNKTTIEGFYGAGEEQGAKDRFFILEADEPALLVGEDYAANPVENLLHALASYLTSTIVYKAASLGIEIESIDSTLEEDMDLRAFLGVSSDERLGYQNIRVAFKIKSDASAEMLKDMAQFSPVLDVVRHGTPVQLTIEKV